MFSHKIDMNLIDLQLVLNLLIAVNWRNNFADNRQINDNVTSITHVFNNFI